MAKVVAPTAARQIVPPASKLQGMRAQQKVPSWMDEIQNLQLQSPVCEVKTATTVTLLRLVQRGVRMSQTEAESSKTVVMPAMMIGATTLEEETTNMEVILENSPGRAQKRKHASSFKKKRLLS